MVSADNAGIIMKIDNGDGCPAEALMREYVLLWQAQERADEKRNSFGGREICDVYERRDNLEERASFVQAESLTGALFQLGLASMWNGAVDSERGERMVGRLIASAARMLVRVGGKMCEYCDPATFCEDGAQAAIDALA
jgi:hypothetical protein